MGHIFNNIVGNINMPKSTKDDNKVAMASNEYRWISASAKQLKKEAANPHYLKSFELHIAR